MTELPRPIARYWYAIDWDVPTLWALNLPVVEVDIGVLIWHLDVPVWPDAVGRPYRVTPRQVIENNVKNSVEFARVQRADLRFPLEVFAINNRLMILDGIHRLTKAYQAGRTVIEVRMVPPSAVNCL